MDYAVTVRDSGSSAYSPTVILIGGPMTLEDGEEFDSRQPVEGDEWSSLAQRTMAASQLWWMAASSLVEAILDEAGQDSYALVVGPRVTAELRDGRLRKRQLRHFFKGRVSNLAIARRVGERKRRSPYQPVAEAPWEEGLHLEVDFGEAGTRWRLLQEDYMAELLPYVVPAIRPAVVVDVDAVPMRLPYREYEAGHLNTTLVLPHSEAAERYVRNVLEWVRDGRPPQENDWAPEMNPSDRYLELERARDQIPIEEAAVVSAATFGVTGLYRDGEWRDPGDLEAARAFIQTHAELRIGIWDLMESPSLRESLLQPTSVSSAPTSAVSTPKAGARRAAEYERAQDEAWDAEEAFRESLGDRLAPLRSLGWTAMGHDEVGVVEVVIGSTADFRLPLTEVYKVEGKDTPLAWLALVLNKRSARVELLVEPWRLFKTVRPYLEARSARLTEIAAPGTWVFASPAVPILWEEKGGWGDDIDWKSRIAQLRERTSRWLEVLADLRPRLVSELADQDVLP